MKKRIILGNCSHWWYESSPDDARATSPRACTRDHIGRDAYFVVGRSPTGLDLVEVAYVDIPFVERATAIPPAGAS